MSRGIPINEVFPTGWRGYFAPAGRVGVGVDVATTTKGKSNPSSIAIVQEVGLDFIARLIIRFKTNNPEVTYRLVEQCLDLPHGLRIRRICIDATSERFFSADLKAKLSGRAVVEPVVSSESIEYLGQKMSVKSYLGNLFVNTIDDGHLWLPSESWMEKDIRSVKSERGSFEADVDEDGNHADCFDSIKLALHALITNGGPAEASAVSVGGLSRRPIENWNNPYAQQFERKANVHY